MSVVNVFFSIASHLQFISLTFSLSLSLSGYLHFPLLTGPDAAFFWFGLITLSNLIIDPIILDYARTFLHVSSLLSLTYWTLLGYSAFEAATLPFSSRNGIIFCLIYRSIPGLLMFLGISQVVMEECSVSEMRIFVIWGLCCELSLEVVVC